MLGLTGSTVQALAVCDNPSGRIPGVVRLSSACEIDLSPSMHSNSHLRASKSNEPWLGENVPVTYNMTCLELCGLFMHERAITPISCRLDLGILRC